MDFSRSSSGSKWVTAPRCATSTSLATICGCLGPGQNARMKKNEMPFWTNCGSGKPMLASSYGLPTSAGLRAIRARGDAGFF